MKELLPKERAFKVVCTNDRNEDQDLFGFYPSAKFASRAIPLLKEQYREWIERCFCELIVKPTDPAMITSPVCTDYEHYNRALIPNEEWQRVMKSDAGAEICSNNMTCGYGFYYKLSQMISKEWTVVDIGCAYNPQSYLFQNHARFIAVNPEWHDSDFHFEHFQAPKTEFYAMTGQTFIKEKLEELNLDMSRTFAICNYVPDESCQQWVREYFKNVWCYYPASPKGREDWL